MALVWRLFHLRVAEVADISPAAKLPYLGIELGSLLSSPYLFQHLDLSLNAPFLFLLVFFLELIYKLIIGDCINIDFTILDALLLFNLLFLEISEFTF